MLKIEILNGVPTTKSGQKNGKPWEIVEQQAWVHLTDQNGQPHPYPSETTIQLERGQSPYLPGVYTLSDSSYAIGDFRRLNVSRPKLVPYPVQAKG